MRGFDRSGPAQHQFTGLTCRGPVDHVAAAQLAQVSLQQTHFDQPRRALGRFDHHVDRVGEEQEPGLALLVHDRRRAAPLQHSARAQSGNELGQLLVIGQRCEDQRVRRVERCACLHFDDIALSRGLDRHVLGGKRRDWRHEQEHQRTDAPGTPAENNDLSHSHAEGAQSGDRSLRLTQAGAGARRGSIRIASRLDQEKHFSAASRQGSHRNARCSSGATATASRSGNARLNTCSVFCVTPGA